ncbi:MAG: beta-aspartyl-peptidase [Ignavibacteriales bacterium]|nr:beta-aspartyl-peptidase [Ignavibacteriales bacterium]
MFTLIRDGEVFAPEPLGRKDVLLAGSTVAAVADPGRLRLDGLEVEVVEAAGRRVLPGLVDPHVHILGGGGEGGPATRAPEIRIEDIVASGVTTVIGCLGTDGVTRHMTSLLAKARALEIEGVSTFIFSGSYDVPVRTLTGSVRSDLILIDKVVGAGEIAVSDHRSSQPTFEELARLAAECRVGGLLGGKAGILHLHLGDGQRGLEPLFRLVRETEIPASQIIPTHITRNPRALRARASIGSPRADRSTSPSDPTLAPAIPTSRSRTPWPRSRSGACPSPGSPPARTATAACPSSTRAAASSGLTIATETDLLRKLGEVVRKGLLPLETAVRIFSSNAADFYKLGGKGRIEPGLDADLLVLDGDFRPSEVFARGRRMMAGGRLVARGTFST